jgi:hypothetical protein
LDDLTARGHLQRHRLLTTMALALVVPSYFPGLIEQRTVEKTWYPKVVATSLDELGKLAEDDVIQNWYLGARRFIMPFMMAIAHLNPQTLLLPELIARAEETSIVIDPEPRNVLLDN